MANKKIILTDEQIKKYYEKFKNSNLMDDLKFRKICESIGAIQEILRTILNDKNLTVKKCIKQKAIDNPIFHGVVLDCECILGNGEIVDVEIQVALDDNPLYRMRYNASMLTVENTPKSKNFKYNNIPKIILIMFCDFDLFGKKEALYEIHRKVNNTNIEADNGVREIYVNINAEVENVELSILFKIIKSISYVDEKSFPDLSKQKIIINKLELGGQGNMNGVLKMAYDDGKVEGMQQGIERGMQQGQEKILRTLFDKGVITDEEFNKEMSLITT